MLFLFAYSDVRRYLFCVIRCICFYVAFISCMHSELDLSEQLINADEPDPIYDLFAVTVSIVTY